MDDWIASDLGDECGVVLSGVVPPAVETRSGGPKGALGRDDVIQVVDELLRVVYLVHGTFGKFAIYFRDG